MRTPIAAFVMLLLPLGLAGQARSLPFDEAGWALEPAAGVRVATHLGRPALVMGNGRALRRDVRFADGTIEFDMAVTGGRDFAYIQFRMASDEDHEEIYFRPHKNGLPDAIQYAPVHQGVSAWQLHHGPGGTAPAEFMRGGWTHVRVVVSGQSAAVYVGDGTAPQLVVPHLARPRAEGYIALRNFLPAGIDPARNATAFANLVIKPGEVPFDFSALTAPAPLSPGTVARWEVSPAFVPDSGPVRVLPAAIRNGGGWKTIPADPRGMVSLAEHLAIPDGIRRWATLARVRLRADRARTVRLLMGFSDEVTLFLNGRPVLSLDQRYFFDNPRQEGVVGLHQGTAYLDLKAGDNEVILAIADQFGGWAVMGRLEEAAGVHILPD